ncbi:MAG: hypothetical protein GF330_11320 [Candidatus Eisenbacteria bacterium]|nr:hypothetical protein [Candidatus Eisenbacteria bacterium]
MKCSDAKRLCCGHLDGELSCAEDEALQEHLRECPACAAQAEQLGACVELLHGLPDVEPGPGFYECVREKIRAAEAGELQVMPETLGGRARVRAWLDGLRLRPAMAAGLWLLLGIVLGGGVAHLAGNSSGEAPATEPAPLAVEAPGGDDVGGDAMAQAGVRSPFWDLELDEPGSRSDTNRFESEFLLEPYVQDRQGGLVPAGMDYQRGVAGDRDAQDDVYPVF